MGPMRRGCRRRRDAFRHALDEPRLTLGHDLTAQLDAPVADIDRTLYPKRRCAGAVISRRPLDALISSTRGSRFPWGEAGAHPDQLSAGAVRMAA